ncbi:MAG: helix-turn-helix domain-containing protein [Pseudomonadota bacterium]
MSLKSFEREPKLLAPSSTSPSRPPAPIAHAVSDSLGDYFRALNGHAPANLYDVILAQVEPPLLKATLAYCRGNQSKAADVLGLNRATLRKKLTQYKITAKSSGSALGNSRSDLAERLTDRRQ